MWQVIFSIQDDCSEWIALFVEGEVLFGCIDKVLRPKSWLKLKKKKLCFELSLVCYQVQCKWDYEIPYVWLKSCKSRVRILFFRITKAILQHVLLCCLAFILLRDTCFSILQWYILGNFNYITYFYNKATNGSILLKIHISVQHDHNSKKSWIENCQEISNSTYFDRSPSDGSWFWIILLQRPE